MDTSEKWVVDLSRREVRACGVPVPLGSRAFDVLEVLVQSAGDLVTKDELMRRVWRGAIVEDSTLQIQISAIRKAFGPDRGMLKTVFGRGYRLFGSWKVEQRSVVAVRAGPPEQADARPFLTNLPARASDLIGRHGAIRHLPDLLSAYRIVTLTGSGGIGKTSLALEVARNLFPAYGGDVWLVELGPLSDPRLVPSAVWAALDLKVGGNEISARTVAEAIAGRKCLLVLDNCEHVVDAAASFVETLISLCPHATVLVTSREVLRIAGERVYRVPPLEVPRDGQGDDPDNLIGHSAVELFIARTTALRSDFSSRAENLQAIAAICRHLDGIPLAIEFAAAQAATLGIRQVVSHLDDRLRLLTSSRRTALPRHQTLRATLDWSYELLPEPERRLLRRLAVFPAGFTLESAIAVANEPDVATAEFAGGISNLLSKSLLSTDESEDRWRLLETIRAYALEKLAESGEADQIARRHAGHLCALLAQAGSEWDQRPTSDWLASYSGEIDGIRAALDWAWSPDGDVEIGIALTVAAIPLWLEMWLLEECRGRAEQAMAILDKEGAEVDRRRMHLCVAVATTQAYAMYPARDTRSVWAAVLEIARKLGDAEYQLRALWGIWGTHVNRGELREALAIAKQFSAFAADSSDANDRLVGDRLAGAVLHFLGDQSEARDHIERMLAAYSTPLRRSHAVRFQSDQRVTAQMYLARILWLQGCADQATRMVAANVADARLTRHPQSFCNALAGAACPVSLWSGDLAAAKRHTDALLDQTSREVLEIWRAHGVCFEGELLVKLGDVSMGLQRLEAGVEQLVRSEFGQYLPAFMGVLAEACIAVGQGARARTLIEDAIARSERSEGRWCSPELLRIRGTIILRMNSADAATDAQKNFLESLDLARRQGALAWQLRSATSLSRLWRKQGHTDNAYRLLETVYARFSEGHGTADLKAARDLLRELSPERQ